RALREAWGRRVGLPAASWMLEIGTFLMRSESELVLKSRRVVPRQLLESGFEFMHPTWPEAARDLCRRWRAGVQASACTLAGATTHLQTLQIRGCENSDEPRLSNGAD